MSDFAALGIAVLLLGANAFFVGAEFALISARRSMIEPRAESGSRSARVTLGAMENVSLMMAGAQLGITICSLGLGALGEPAVAHLLERPFEGLGIPEALLHPVAFAIALGIVVFLHVVIGEMVPKNLALAAPERAALALGPPLVLVVRMLRPLIALLNAIANAVLRLIGVPPKDEITSAFTRDEVAGLVTESRREGLLDREEHALLSQALFFEERDARSVLLPVDRLVTVARGASPAEIEALAVRTGFSRFPSRTADGRIEGYVHLKDALAVDDDQREQPLPTERLRALTEVAPETGLRAVLAAMQPTGSHLARVVDPEDGELGVVALEDVLEELVGQVRDETRRERAAA